MGQPGSRSPKAARGNSSGATYCPSGNGTNEGGGPKPCLVAQYRQGHRGDGKVMCNLPTDAKCSYSGTTHAMGMATDTLDTHLCGLCPERQDGLFGRHARMLPQNGQRSL